MEGNVVKALYLELSSKYIIDKWKFVAKKQDSHHQMENH